MTMMTTQKVQQLVYGLSFLALTVTAAQALGRGSATPKITPEQPCKGDPIFVEYPFEGGFLDPHACSVQCGDNKQRFVYYANEKATQCETPPGCNDWGEDRGITCIPPDDLVSGEMTTSTEVSE